MALPCCFPLNGPGDNILPAAVAVTTTEETGHALNSMGIMRTLDFIIQHGLLSGVTISSEAQLLGFLILVD